MTEDRTDYLAAADWSRTFTVVPEWGTESAAVQLRRDRLERERLAVMPRSVLECLVPPLPGRLARAINVGSGGEVER